MAKVLIPGSFDPLHNGHVDVVDQAYPIRDRQPPRPEGSHALRVVPMIDPAHREDVVREEPQRPARA